MIHMGLLCNKVCIVTGAGGGIGGEICRAFAAEGAEAVVAIEHREGTVDAWRNNFEYAQCIVPRTVEIQDAQQIKALVMDVKKQYGRIDVLVNAAGVEYNEKIGFISHAHMEQMFSTNVFGLIELLQYSARVMMRKNAGSIINIASVVGIYGNPGQMVYSATKGAVISLTKSASKELAPYGIRVNAIAPGLTDTKMIADTSKEMLEQRIQRIGLGRMASVADVANAAVFLASERANYITGQILGVDGGTVM